MGQTTSVVCPTCVSALLEVAGGRAPPRARLTLAGLDSLGLVAHFARYAWQMTCKVGHNSGAQRKLRPKPHSCHRVRDTRENNKRRTAERLSAKGRSKRQNNGARGYCGPAESSLLDAAAHRKRRPQISRSRAADVHDLWTQRTASVPTETRGLFECTWLVERTGLVERTVSPQARTCRKVARELEVPG